MVLSIIVETETLKLFMSKNSTNICCCFQQENFLGLKPRVFQFSFTNAAFLTYQW